MWSGLNRRCRDNEKVKVRMSREAFVDWAIPEVESFFAKQKNERPVLHRKWNTDTEDWHDYEIGGMKLVTRKEHAEIHNHFFAVNSHSFSLLGMFYISTK